MRESRLAVVVVHLQKPKKVRSITCQKTDELCKPTSFENRSKIIDKNRRVLPIDGSRKAASLENKVVGT